MNWKTRLFSALCVTFFVGVSFVGCASNGDQKETVAEKTTQETQAGDAGSQDNGQSEPTPDNKVQNDNNVQQDDKAQDTGPDNDVTKDETKESDTPEKTPVQEVVTPENFLKKSAAAICGALFRCCSEDSQKTYFRAFLSNSNLKAFHNQLPPNAKLDETQCKSVVEKMFAIIPFGDWLKEVKAKRVSFNAKAAQTCIKTLSTAACGKPAWTALTDGTCLAFNAPAGGNEQRKIFQRTADDGNACGSIRDGFGALYYGSCDPNKAFCCFPSKTGDKTRCSVPTAGAVGTCRPVANKGESCKALAPIKVCKTGLSCDGAKKTCVAPNTKPLNVGDDCIDTSFNFLGVCKGGWCDVIGSKKCKPLKEMKEACLSGQECKSGACVNKVCADFNLCISK